MVPVFASLVVAAWMAVGMAIADYLTLRHQVAQIQAVHKPHGHAKNERGAKDSANSAKGEHQGGHQYPENIHEHAPDIADVLIAIGTALIAWFTLCLYWDARRKGILELRAYVGIPEMRVNLLGNSPQIFLRFENSGKTTAKKLRVALDSEVRLREADAEAVDIYGSRQTLHFRFRSDEFMFNVEGAVHGWTLAPEVAGNDAT